MNEAASVRTVVELFEQQAAKTPKQTAVVLKEEKISYEELNSAANRIAGLLRKKGIGREDLVAVLADKSIETITAILGIIKAGAAYVPVDPNYPVDRINFILEDSQPKLILTNGCEAQLTSNAEVLALRDMNCESESSENPEQINESKDLLYVIYTSGTTGTPKGVMLEHRGVVNLRTYFEKDYQVSEKDVVLQFANLTFDGSVFEMSMALLNGATLCVVPGEMKNDIEWFEEYLEQNAVSIMALPPQYYAQVEYAKARIVITAGSESNKGIVEKALKSSARYINSYGPTEGTVCATHWEATADSVPNIIPIGKPINRVGVCILNGLDFCQIGVPGELCIAGMGLARGYLNRPELTAEKFIKNPFGKGKLYRTGDLAKWLPDGNIEFLGRIDDQIKIRGFRVELGEVESVIREDRRIKDAVVIVRSDDSGEKEINAYIVSNEEIDIAALRKELQKKLPDHMIPVGMMQIDKIPLTPNGKPNKKELPTIAFSRSGEYVEPVNKLQKYVLQVWQKVLKKPEIGIRDDFFEVGGNSINILSIVSELREKGLVVKVKDMHNYSTVETLCKNVLEEQKFDYSLVDVEELVIVKHDNMISSITENTDDFKWEEYNCFYKPVSIICQAYSADYFDIVTLNHAFYTLYGIGGHFDRIIGSGEFDHEYVEFFEKVLRDKLKLKVDLVSYYTAEQMHSIIKENIDKQNPVLVSMDSGCLFYSNDYMTRSHFHYMIIKGYDTKKKIYMTLDNMQLEKGSSTIYKDFAIPFDVLYESAMSYREHLSMTEDSKMYVFKNIARRSETRYSASEALRDHIAVITGMHQGAISYTHLEEETIHAIEQLNSILTTNIPENSDAEWAALTRYAVDDLRNQLSHIPQNEHQKILSQWPSMLAGKFAPHLNMKSCYFKTLNSLLDKCHIDGERMEDLKQCEAKVIELWKSVKQIMFMIAVQESVDFHQLMSIICAAKEQETVFREKLIACADLLDDICETDKAQLEAEKYGYYLDNPKGAKVNFGQNSLRIELDPNEIYDLWLYNIHAPRVGREVISDHWEALVRVGMRYSMGEGCTQDGFVINLEDGSKFLYGVVNDGLNMCKLEIQCPELNEKYRIYAHSGVTGDDSVKIRVGQKGEELHFDFIDSRTNRWHRAKSIICKTKVESVALGTRSWEKTYHVAHFEDIHFNW